jgi:hypothetical protein
MYYINRYGGTMEKEPVDLEAVQRITAKLDRVLEEYPELLEANPERQQALEAWLAELEQGGHEHGV